MGRKGSKPDRAEHPQKTDSKRVVIQPHGSGNGDTKANNLLLGIRATFAQNRISALVVQNNRVETGGIDRRNTECHWYGWRERRSLMSGRSFGNVGGSWAMPWLQGLFTITQGQSGKPPKMVITTITQGKWAIIKDFSEVNISRISALITMEPHCLKYLIPAVGKRLEP
jgi:hypothetical protein